MVSNYRCYFCFARAFEKLLDNENLSVEDKNSFVSEMSELYSTVGDTFSSPEYSRTLHAILRKYTNNSDPYKLAKKQSNDLVMSMYSDLKNKIQQSDNPFDTAMRLAIAGNIMDFAIDGNFDLQATINKVLQTDFAIDHSEKLRKAIAKAKTVLYLGDNCGEIVFDKLFIETIMHPNLVYAVRGAKIINDATIEDAHYVGMDLVADLLSNGYDAPSTIVEKCSIEFQDVFNSADVIISKGQGNLEGLLENKTNEIYFLLMVNCEAIADALAVKKGDFVVKKNTEI